MKTELLGDGARFFSPVGELILRTSPRGLVEVQWTRRRSRNAVGLAERDGLPPGANRPVLERAAGVLERYFEGNAVTPEVLHQVPADLSGLTRFQQLVMSTLVANVPWGAVISYAELAALAGHPGAARAVGSVMARNPLPLFIPCHRVVGASGPGGFGPGLPIKRELLRREGFELLI